MEIVRISVDNEDLIRNLIPLFDSYRQFCGCSSNRKAIGNFIYDRLENDECVLFAALDEASSSHAILGFVNLYPSFSTLLLSRIVILNDLYIRPDVRRQGIATKLLKQARSYAESIGAQRLELQVLKDDAGVHRLYRSNGYEENQRDSLFTLTIKKV